MCSRRTISTLLIQSILDMERHMHDPIVSPASAKQAFSSELPRTWQYASGVYGNVSLSLHLSLAMIDKSLR
jgi:hypothetical protein